MRNYFTVVESRMETDGSRRHIVQAPGGTVVVIEDNAGNLSGQLRSGYVATGEDGEETVGRALEAVHELHQRSNSAQGVESNRSIDFLDK